MDISDLRNFRRHLHSNPELSNEEYSTQKLLKSHLDKLDHDGLKEVGKTGLIVTFKGKGPGRKVLLRADMDALPIEEENDFEYRSAVKGVSHKCGHDGHATILLGLAYRLSDEKPERGEVQLVFQPAEENGTGARSVIEDAGFTFEPDLVFALHNLPGYSRGMIVCKKGSFTASAKSVIFKLKGKTSHAAEPEKGINPALAVSEVLQLSEELSKKDTEAADFRLITTVYVKLGEKAYGVSAGNGEVHFTLRSWDNDNMKDLAETLAQRAHKIAKSHSLDLDEKWLEVFYANVNDEEAYQIIKTSAEDCGLSFEERKEPFKWGEDFGLFTEKYPGAMFGIGAGESTPALHNPDYDFPDDIIDTGIEMFGKILKHTL